jgi:hypothetical protein
LGGRDLSHQLQQEVTMQALRPLSDGRPQSHVKAASKV